MREFHIGDVLSVVADPLVSPRHLEGVADLLSYMTGEQLEAKVSVLAPVGTRMRPVLLEQLPQFKELEGVSVMTSELDTWIGAQIDRFGPTVNVMPA